MPGFSERAQIDVSTDQWLTDLSLNPIDHAVFELESLSLIRSPLSG
jgi:hypothetical protein